MSNVVASQISTGFSARSGAENQIGTQPGPPCHPQGICLISTPASWSCGTDQESPCLCLTCLAWRKASETLQLDERLPMIIDKLARPLAPSKILFQSVVTTLALRCVTR